MMEAHKTAATKAANQQAAAAVGTLASSTNANSIMNYLQRKPATNQTSQQQSQLTAQLQQPVLVEDSKPADDESLKGHFGWESFAGGKIHIPYIMRQAEKYCAVRIIEQKLLNKYLNYLHQDLYNCTCVCSYYITDVESRLLNEINFKHCDSIYGKEQFSMRDLIVRLSDAQKFFQFLDVCYKKLLMNCSTPNDKCGFIRINNESVVPYTVRDGQKMVPLFYFEGETDNLKLKADSLSGWDLSYLKFCCKVQGIRNELFASETVAVISLDDIKSYFPQGTIFEDYWPNKVVDSQLLVGSKSQNSVVHWTHPPPKQMSNPTPKPAPQQQQQQQQQLQQQQQQQQQHQKPQRSLPTGNSNGNSLHQQQAYHTTSPVTASPTRASPQSLYAKQPSISPASPMHNLLPAVLQQQIDELLLKQNYNMNGLSNQDILKGTLLSTYANYTKAQQQQLQQHLIASAQRSNNSQSYPIRNKSVITSRATMDVIDLSPSSTPRSSMSAAAAAAIQASSKRNLNGQYMNGNQSSRMQQSSSGSSGSSTRSMQQQQHLQDPNGRMLPMPDMSALNGPYGVAYKVQKTLIETSMVNCINMSPYAHSELLIPLSELRDTFYPSVSLDICKRVMNALEIVLYKGNKLQYQAYSEVGKTISENVPLVQVRDVITYLPQLNYMVRGHVQETNVANKRARIS
ncbi:unnamed protein product [Diamesa serratosioi]